MVIMVRINIFTKGVFLFTWNWLGKEAESEGITNGALVSE